MERKAPVRGSPKPRGERISESPRLQQIVGELERMVFAEGFLHLRTEELASRLHCSKQTLYVLAESRDELFAQIIEHLFASIRAEAEQAIQDTPDRTAALALCLEAIRKAAGKISVKFVHDLAQFQPGQQRLREHEQRMVALLAGIIEAGIQDGLFQGINPRLAAEVMVQAASRIVNRDLLVQTGLTLTRAFGELHNLCLHGLIKPAKTEGSDKERNGDPSQRRPVNPLAFR